MEPQYAKNKIFDQFYTKREVAETCVNMLEKMVKLDESVVIEPSAGNGAFLEYLPKHTIAIDLDPKKSGIKQQDFFEYSIEANDKKIVIVGNPPFGICNRLSINFFNHAAKSCNASVIAFIIPKTWRKRSIVIKLDHNFHKIGDMDIPQKAFDDGKVHVACCFQVWERRDILRIDEPRRYPVDGWVFSTADDADFALKKSCTRAGKIYELHELTKPPSSYFFIKITSSDKNKIRKVFERCVPDFMKSSLNVCNRESLAQGEVEKIYNHYV
ncbi:hypothetical protein NY2A_B359R [Paramecium bursaria Chlorella virus NY2A]|uniref:M6A-gamma-methyltransferase M.CviQII n=1 Tax=Paramecium bursaria Chlorella virus NY2A TaxID=46021 RepID=Q0ZLZ6_PBCVN|nr:hypothetical protein NY2A_B359R [Paramecium bursaria Chlorella virus NY2A]ABC86588.1 m6A-gamma-methyltransferase M.CviQII [Paramecium bursaria Chlorella virus NY2A]ABT14758.1 hypothetical protein NY2A_B359R [Paramecium bursaria Chlorella virus NY2A]